MSATDYSLWLMPDDASQAELTGLHAGLSDAFGAPRFEPHLTLIGGVPLDFGAAKAALPRLAEGIAPFEDTVQAIVLSRMFFRSFYALFPAGGFILDLKTRAMAMILGEGLGAFTPHVSLLYGDVEPGAKAAARERIAGVLEGRRIRFESLALALSSERVPIADWRIVHSHPLG